MQVDLYLQWLPDYPLELQEEKVVTKTDTDSVTLEQEVVMF